MRPTTHRNARFGVALVALMMVAAACSIEAPDVILSGGSGPGGAIPTNGAVPGLPGSTVAPGTSTGGGGTGSGGSAPNAADTSCVGKATTTGVSATEIKLGGTFAISGPVSNISGPILKGVQAYFEEVNRAGGIHGRRIRLIVKDDGWDAQRGKALIKELVEQDKVFTLTVVPSSNGLDASKSYLESKGVPVFGTSGLIESQFRSPMQWPVGTSTRSAARISILDIKKRGVKNAAIIWLDLLAGKEGRDAFVEGLKPLMGVEPDDFVTSERRVSISEADFGPVWAQIESDTKSWQRAHGQDATGRPDFVALLIDPTNAIKAFQAAQQRGFKPAVGWGGGAPLFLGVVAQNAYAKQTGLLAGTSYFPPLPEIKSQVKAVQDYENTLRDYYGSSIDPLNPYLEGGFAGAALTVEVLKRAGSCLNRGKVISAANSLTDYSAAGLTQQMSYRGSHYGNVYGLVVQVQPNGQWKVASEWLKDPSPGE